jgi:cytochrome c556
MPGTKLNIAFGSIVVVSLAACGGATAPAEPVSAEPAPPAEPEPVAVQAEPAEPKPKPDVPPPGAPLERIMEAHFKDALLIREAVIKGKSEEAAEPAGVLTRIHDLNDLPNGWRPYMERMQQAAERIKDGTSAAQVAAAAADLGTSCGMCHQSHGGSKAPKPAQEPAPTVGKSVESRMKLHAWATERLWEGLYVPSSDAWKAGAQALQGGEPFPQEVLKEGGVHARSAASEFAKIVAQAPAKKTAEERASLYANLLVTCGTCHQAVGRE